MNILRIIIFLLASTSLFADTKIRLGTQTQGTLPASQGGVPTGGTINQILTKGSNSDLDTVWSPGGLGSGNVIAIGTPLLDQLAIWTDSTHIKGQAVTFAGQDRSVTFVVRTLEGQPIITGVKRSGKIPFGGTLVGWTMMCNPQGSITVQLLRSADGAGLPVSSISGTGNPAISLSVENHSTNFTGWSSTTLTPFDNLALNVLFVANVNYVTFTLYYR